MQNPLTRAGFCVFDPATQGGEGGFPAGKRDSSFFLLQCNCASQTKRMDTKVSTPLGTPFPLSSAGSFRTAPVCGLVCSSMPARPRPEGEEGQSMRCSSRKRFSRRRCRDLEAGVVPGPGSRSGAGTSYLSVQHRTQAITDVFTARQAVTPTRRSVLPHQLSRQPRAQTSSQTGVVRTSWRRKGKRGDS